MTTENVGKQGGIQDIADRLATEFSRLIPLRASQAGRSKKGVGDYGVPLKRFYEAAQKERIANRLGIIGRARVAFALQQRLLNVGYPADLVKQVLFAMLAAAFVGNARH